MNYKDDERMVTMEEIEEILTNAFGDSEYDRESGCYHDGKWFSVESVLEEISRNI